MPPTLGLCSWSLHPTNVHELVERVKATGLTAVQLALTPIAEQQPGWDERETIEALKTAGITILSGMLATVGEDYSTLNTIRDTGGVRSDKHWEANLVRARKVAELAERLKIRLVTFHAGFLPHDRQDPLYPVMMNRIKAIGSVFSEQEFEVQLAFETGQESADTLKTVLVDLQAQSSSRAIGANFDPANMILYGMGDPLSAVQELGLWIKQVHIKDAIPTSVPGTWGRETSVGHGAVDWPAFFRYLSTVLPHVDCIIEREAGEKRIDDIKAAAALVRSLHPGIKG